jgi:hypothetical protein
MSDYDWDELDRLLMKQLADEADQAAEKYALKDARYWASIKKSHKIPPRMRVPALLHVKLERYCSRFVGRCHAHKYEPGRFEEWLFNTASRIEFWLRYRVKP